MLMFWDEAKRETNFEIHGLDFADARDRFEWESAIVGVTRSGSDGRDRFLATGMLNGELATLVFALLGSEAVSAISLRPASRRERRRYGA